MAYKLILPDGLILECDSAEELRAALSIVRRPPSIMQPPMAPPQPPVPVPVEIDTGKLRRFIRGISGRQRIILNRLAGAPNGLTDEDLRAALEIETNSELAGTMAGLSKNAKKDDFNISQVLTKTQFLNGTGRHYHYRLTEVMKSAMPGN